MHHSQHSPVLYNRVQWQVYSVSNKITIQCWTKLHWLWELQSRISDQINIHIIYVALLVLSVLAQDSPIADQVCWLAQNILWQFVLGTCNRVFSFGIWSWTTLRKKTMRFGISHAHLSRRSKASCHDLKWWFQHCPQWFVQGLNQILRQLSEHPKSLDNETATHYSSDAN